MKLHVLFCVLFSQNEIFSFSTNSSKNCSIFTTNFWKLWLTGRGVARVNYEVPRLSKLHEEARRCSKDFQQVWYKLELFKVCRDDMPCKVKKILELSCCTSNYTAQKIHTCF